MSGGDHNSDQIDDALGRDKPRPQDTPAPGSVTQMLGGKSNQSSPPADGPDNAPSVAPPRSDSFTKAFVGVNAFSRDPAGLTQYTLDSEAKQEAAADFVPQRSPGSFTRLFGSGEGVLSPSGTDGHSRPPTVPDAELRSPPRSHESSPGSFTEQFDSHLAATPPGLKKEAPSFPKEFDSARSWQMSNPSTPSANAFPGRSESRGPVLPPNPKPPSPPTQAFERLVRPSRPDPTASTGATIVFNRSGSPEREIAEAQAESDYTMVRRLSDLRSGKEGSGAAVSPGSPSGAPAVPQREQFGPAAPPVWTPPEPKPPWQQPAPPPVPQPPTFAPPRVPQRPPSLGDRLISLLPFMLALTVINFLGLLAVLIILFATRK